MKKTLSVTAFILVLVFCMAPVVLASELYYPVIDEAELLTNSQRNELIDRAEALLEKYNCEIVIVTVSDMEEYGFNDAFKFVTYIDDEFDFGYGNNRSYLILFLSMADRDYWLEPYGDAETVFTKHGIDTMLDKHILPLLKNNNFYDAFSVYLDKSEEYLIMARDGAPFDRDTDPAARTTDFLIKLAVTIIIPILIALVICSIWKRQMKTAVLAKTADNYIPPGGFNLTRQSDDFLYRTTTRRKIQSSSSGSSFGGSRGRGGKF